MERVEIGDAVLYHGDCLEILPTLPKVDAVVTDPPYGMDWAFTGQGSGKNAQGGKNSVTKGQRIANDSKEFDPTHLLGFERVVIWGMHHFPQHLRRGSVLVWPKKYIDAYGTFLSDADLAWMNSGCGVYMSRVINPASFQSDKTHPTQKPVDLMEWCIERVKCPVDGTVVDPYMGSGTTGVACAQLGRKFIGIEIERRYFDIACERIEKAYAQGRLFDEPKPAAKQAALL